MKEDFKLVLNMIYECSKAIFLFYTWFFTIAILLLSKASIEEAFILFYKVTFILFIGVCTFSLSLLIKTLYKLFKKKEK